MTHKHWFETIDKSFSDVLTLSKNRLQSGFSNEDVSQFKEFVDWHRTILAPTNDVVNELNEHIMTLIPRETKTYLSLDVPCSVVGHVDTLDVVHTLELLNTIATLGLPNHKLKLMIGFHIMLLRNIDQYAGLCNGTRFIVTQMDIHVLQAKVIFGSKIGEKSRKIFEERWNLFSHGQLYVIISRVMTCHNWKVLICNNVRQISDNTM
ncbi:hypothetical protein JHK87_012531 [Glycine soja]|nr:hypothetical protein JHK87_012531 [Glycine soja]